MDVATLIERGASYYGDRTAIVFEDKRLTFKEVNQRANQLANGLLELGVKKGGVVASLNRNCPQYVEIFFAKHKIGAVDATLNPRLSNTEIAWQLNDLGAETLIVEEEEIPRIIEIRPNLEQLKRVITISGTNEDTIDYETLLQESSIITPNISTTERELGRVIYTTGTTGKPKGVMLPRISELAVARNLLLDMVPDLGYEDVFLGLQPLYHAAGYFILPCWIRGSTHAIMRDFKAEAAFPVINDERVSVIKTVPTVLVRLVEHTDWVNYDLSSLRAIIYGASPIPAEKLKQAIRMFGPILIQNYSQTEATTTACLLKRNEHILEGKPEEVARLASVGRPYTLVDVRVVDETGMDVKPGEMGEVIVRGDHVMLGYWKDSDKTAEALKDGWVHTRDIGRIDQQGYIFLVDRKSEMIISGGLNIYPAEVEQVLYKHPAVQEVAVFGVPDEKWGEAVKAVVVVKASMAVTEEELKSFCLESLARHKRPQSVDFVDSLPRSPEGKVLRRELKDRYWKGLERRIH